MEDHLGPAPGDHLHQLAGADVELVEGELVGRPARAVGQVGQRPGRQVVDHVDGMALGQQPVDEVRADEAGSAGHHRLHAAPHVIGAAAGARTSSAPSAGTRASAADLRDLVVAHHRQGRDSQPSATTPRRVRGSNRVTAAPARPGPRAGAPSPRPRRPARPRSPAPMTLRAHARPRRRPRRRRREGRGPDLARPPWARRAAQTPAVDLARPRGRGVRAGSRRADRRWAWR